MPPRTPLRYPFEYFDTPRDPLLPGLGVFVAYVLTEFIAVVWLAFWVLGRAENLPRQAHDAMWDIIPPLFIGYLIVVTIAITVVTLVMHYWSSGDKDGTIAQTLAVVGWSYAPNLIAVLASVAWLRYDLRGLTLQGEDPAVLQEELSRIGQDIAGVADLGIAIVVVVWSIFILTYGVAAIQDIDPSDTWPPALIIGIGSIVLGLLF